MLLITGHWVTTLILKHYIKQANHIAGTITVDFLFVFTFSFFVIRVC